ncbi:hypothetical protein Hanom_Chr02g00164011 [Helianthus anomalus]
MAEIATVDHAEATVDVEVEKEIEVEKVDADQTTEVQEENLKSDEEKDVVDKKMVVKFVAYMADLSKSTREVNFNPVSSVYLKCCELQGEVDRLSIQNQSLINDLSSLKESNFFRKKKRVFIFEEN